MPRASVQRRLEVSSKEIKRPVHTETEQVYELDEVYTYSVQGKGLVELIGVTNRYTAKGAETALMLLNSSGWSVINSTRIDNEVVSTTDYFRIMTGKAWLAEIDKNWEKNFLRPENKPPTGANSQTGSNNQP